MKRVALLKVGDDAWVDAAEVIGVCKLDTYDGSSAIITKITLRGTGDWIRSSWPAAQVAAVLSEWRASEVEAR